MKIVVTSLVALMIGAGFAVGQDTAARIRVTLDVDDHGGDISRGFAGALRALGDVDLVTARETPDVTLRVSPIRLAGSHALVMFVEVLQGPLAEYLAKVPDERVREYFSRAEFLRRALYSGVGERDTLDGNAREVVADVDKKCFEEIRTFRRALRLYATGDSIAGQRAEEAWTTVDGWGCT